jgi:hypothetical protein
LFVLLLLLCGHHRPLSLYGQSISKRSRSPRRLQILPPLPLPPSVLPSVLALYAFCDCFSSGSIALPFLFPRASYLVRFAQSVYGVS